MSFNSFNSSVIDDTGWNHSWNNSAPMPTLAPLEGGFVGSDILYIYTCLGLFALIAVFSVLTFVRTGKAVLGSPVTAGLLMRRKLAVGLFFASLARCAALGASIAAFQDIKLPVVGNMEGAEQRWMEDLILLFPDTLFLSVFSLVVLFWAQLHFTTAMVPLPLLDCFFVGMNVAFLLLIGLLAVGTFYMHAYDHLRSYMICVIGFLNLAVAGFLMYYGVMVVSDLVELARKKTDGRQLPRILALSVVVPVGLLLRSAVYLAWDASLERPSLRMDLLLCLLSEWLPAAVSLMVLGPLTAGGAAEPSGDLGDSSDSELGAALLDDDAKVDYTWKKLYPQPSS